MANPADGAHKLALVLTPLLNEISTNIKQHITIETQEILQNQQVLIAKIDVLEKLVAEKKAKAPAKKAPSAADAATSGTTAATAETAAPSKSFAINKLVYFRDQYKSDAEFRKRFTTPAIQKAIDDDPAIKKKTNEAQKIIAGAVLCWNLLKKDNADLIEVVTKEYEAAKAAHEAAKKLPQQTVEKQTPPPEPKGE